MTDIVSERLLLGGGWSNLDLGAATTFRLIDGEATMLFADAGQDYVLLLDIAPAEKHMSPLRCTCSIEGAEFHASEVVGRSLLRCYLPPSKPVMRPIVIRVDGGSARIFSIFVRACQRDVVELSQGFRIGRGWYALDSFPTIPFRSVNRSAEVIVTRPAQLLSLCIEPGLGVGFAPFELCVGIRGGAEFDRKAIDGRTPVNIELPKFTSFPQHVTLSCETGGRPTFPTAQIQDFSALVLPRV